MLERLNRETRIAVITDAALRCANARGLHAVTHPHVAELCEPKTSVATVRRYFHLVRDLQLAVVEAEPKYAKTAKRLGLTK